MGKRKVGKKTAIALSVLACVLIVGVQLAWSLIAGILRVWPDAAIVIGATTVAIIAGILLGLRLIAKNP